MPYIDSDIATKLLFLLCLNQSFKSNVMKKLNFTLIKSYAIIFGILIILTTLIIAFSFRADNMYNIFYITSIICYIAILILSTYNLHLTYSSLYFKEYLKGYGDATKHIKNSKL